MSTVEVVHIRKRGGRSPHHVGRITPDHVLDRDPRRRTLCGAEPTDRDIAYHQASWKSWRSALDICTTCLAEIKERAA